MMRLLAVYDHRWGVEIFLHGCWRVLSPFKLNKQCVSLSNPVHQEYGVMAFWRVHVFIWHKNTFGPFFHQHRLLLFHILILSFIFVFSLSSILSLLLLFLGRSMYHGIALIIVDVLVEIRTEYHSNSSQRLPPLQQLELNHYCYNLSYVILFRFHYPNDPHFFFFQWIYTVVLITQISLLNKLQHNNKTVDV